jgi:3-dehydroquinate synthase
LTGASTRVTVDLGPRSYDVVVGAGALGEVGGLLAGRRRVAVVSQAAVAERWAGHVLTALASAGVAVDLVLMGDGEDAKRLSTVDALCSRFAAGGLLRDDAVVALGGGVVGDTAGFAASCYHRGVAVVQAPTTLLAMVDAAIGGKTAVNLPEGKNLVGAFHQPIGVVADVATLATLPEREYRAGLAEVAKYAVLRPGRLYDLLVSERAAVLARDPSALVEVVGLSAQVKADVVALDEHERTGLRATLNYGHTLAHALETHLEHSLNHGEAVAVGMVFAAELAAAMERVPPAEAVRQRELVAGLGLPVAVPEPVAATELDPLLRRDKKAEGGLTFVLCGSDGVTRVDDPPPAALAAAYAAVGVTA